MSTTNRTILVFGPTGMIGQGAVNAALSDDRVSRVLAVTRRSTGRSHPRLEEIIHDDFFDYSSIIDRIGPADSCLFCLGISSAGRTEAEYRRITLDLTLNAARSLARHNPEMTFVYLSAQGTRPDSRQMWARVRSRTEAELSALPFAAVYHARPGFVQPVDGVRSRTTLYRIFYAVTSPLFPLLRRLAPRHIIDNRDLGRALIEAGIGGATQSVLEVPDLHALADRARAHHPE